MMRPALPTRYSRQLVVSLIAVCGCSRTPYCERFPTRGECAPAAGETAAGASESDVSGDAGTTSGAGAIDDEATSDDTDTSDDGGVAGDEPPKWDLVPPPDDSYFACGQPGHTVPGSSTTGLIWIPMPSSALVTKYDVDTLEQLGTYYVQPDTEGQPSLISVSLSGNPIVISRTGEGITKFLSDIPACEDRNGMDGIQTSTGSEPLPWDIEECRAWHVSTADTAYTVSVASWTPGVIYGEDCRWIDEKIWLTGNNSPGVEVSLLDGDDGSILHTVDVFSLGLTAIQSGASDAEGNFWGVTNDRLVRVDRHNFVALVWDIPAGFPAQMVTVGPAGNIWTCSRGHVARFDPLTEEWLSTSQPSNYAGGCAFDDEGTIYVKSNSLATAFDAISMDTLETIETYDPQQWWLGLTTDFAGRIWLTGASPVLRVSLPDLELGSFALTPTTTFSSDLTGHALHAIL